MLCTQGSLLKFDIEANPHVVAISTHGQMQGATLARDMDPKDFGFSQKEGMDYKTKRYEYPKM
jgi:hypothetical protein